MFSDDQLEEELNRLVQQEEGATQEVIHTAGFTMTEEERPSSRMGFRSDEGIVGKQISTEAKTIGGLQVNMSINYNYILILRQGKCLFYPFTHAHTEFDTGILHSSNLFVQPKFEIWHNISQTKHLLSGPSGRLFVFT